MGSFTSTTPGTRDTKAAPAASSHADQIQGASVSATPLAPAPASMPVYSHADQIMGASIMPGDQPGFRIDPVDFPDPSNSPWLNPPAMNANVLNPFGGTGGTGATAASAAPGPAPPPLPQKPAPASTPKPGLTGRVPGTGGQTPIYRPNELEGGGNTVESADYVQKKNADAAKLAETEARVEAHHAEERAKVARERQKTAEKLWRRHAKETADARKAQVAQQHKLAKALTAKVRQVMEPAGHPGLTDDAEIVQAARRAPLSAEAAAANDRQAKALGKIGGVGDLPLYTSDAAENYGDKGIDEVADLIHRTAATDPAKGKQLLDQTTARLSAEKAEQLRQTVASFQLDDDSGQRSASSSELQAQKGSITPDSKTPTTEKEMEKEKEKEKEKEIEWNDKPSEQVYDGRNVFNVDGPIKIDPKSIPGGLDGIEHDVDWYTLDKDGNVVPEWRTEHFTPQRRGSHILFGEGKSGTHIPPIPSKYGYRVIIRVPPQPTYNGNSAGGYLDVYSPKGTRLNKITR